MQDERTTRLGADAPPDMRGWTIWQTIANTIAGDDLTVYLNLDEAHRGPGQSLHSTMFGLSSNPALTLNKRTRVGTPSLSMASIFENVRASSATDEHLGAR